MQAPVSAGAAPPPDPSLKRLLLKLFLEGNQQASAILDPDNDIHRVSADDPILDQVKKTQLSLSESRTRSST